MGRRKNTNTAPAETFIRITKTIHNELYDRKISSNEKIHHIISRLLKEHEEYKTKFRDLTDFANEMREAVQNHLRNNKALLKDISMYRDELIIHGVDPDELIRVKRLEALQRND